MSRQDELARNVNLIRAEVTAAAEAAHRNPADITIIAITKTWPASDVRILHALGVRDFGESKDQEAAPKVEECGDLDATWHFVGQLQTNKVNHVVRYADVVHSVDRPKLVTTLGRAASELGRTVTALVQVSLDGGPDRGGVEADHALELANLVAGTPGLVLGGVMAVAPLNEGPASAFARLGQVAHRIQQQHPQATIISAGMSDDFREAILAGATHLRIGSSLLGSRPSVG